MLGAITGDIIGSIYEHYNTHSRDFELFSPTCRFTDDTVLTVALADSVLSGKTYVDKLEEYYYRYPDAGYGGNFHVWASGKLHQPYNSWGNGSAMRVSPVAYAWDDLEDVLAAAEASAAVTHNHPEGIKGAQATAAAIFFARTGRGQSAIQKEIEARFGYDLNESIDSIREWYTFDVSCQGSVPQAIRAFLEADSYESAVRNAISIGGDSDTIACITGSIAEAMFGVPDSIADRAMDYLDDHLLNVTQNFRNRFLRRSTLH